MTTFVLDPDTLVPLPKATHLYVLQNGNSIYQYDLQLGQYIEKGAFQGSEAIKVELTKGKEIPAEANILGLTFKIELVECLDDDGQSHQVLRKMMMSKKQLEEEEDQRRKEKEQQAE